MHSIGSCGRFPIVRAKIHGRVLVVDDEPLVRWALVAGLRHAGFDADGAAAPEEVQRLAAPPDLVLLDVGLWGRDPLHVLDAIRSIAPLARILLLAVEGQDVPLPAWQDVDVIRKPFDLDAVIRRVGTTLACRSHGVRMAV